MPVSRGVGWRRCVRWGRRPFHLGEPGHGARGHGTRHVQQIAPPSVELTGADAVLACDLGRAQLRTQALGDDLALLLRRPRTPALAARDDLDLLAACAPTTSRTSALVALGRLQTFIHDRLRSHQSTVPPCAAPATLTRGKPPVALQTGLNFVSSF